MQCDSCCLVSSGSLASNKEGDLSDKGRYSLEWPDSCVIRVELHHNVPVGPHLLNVTALGVVGVHDGSIPGARALGQDVHVESVEMDGVTAESS